MDLYTAFLFLTRIPLPQIPFDEQKIPRTVTFFPVVGLCIGIVLWGLYKLLSPYFTIQVTMALILMIYMIITGGMHTDGFADTMDGFFCGGDRQKKMDVMKDSRVGAFGAIGIVMLLILKWSLLYSLNPYYVKQSLFVFPMISRWLMTISIIYFPYIRPTGLGKAFGACSDYKRSLYSTSLTMFIVYFLAGFQGLAVGLIALIVALLFIWYSLKQIGGLTGDIYGAVNEIGELVVLIACNIIYQ